MADAERPLDRLHIVDLALRCIVGINDQERREKQDVKIQATLHADLSRSCRSDRIEDTVDYKAIKKKIVKMVESSQFLLVERLAQAVADICLEDARVQRADVRVEKPGALRFARTVAVEISRFRETADRRRREKKLNRRSQRSQRQKPKTKKWR